MRSRGGPGSSENPVWETRVGGVWRSRSRPNEPLVFLVDHVVRLEPRR